MTKLKVLMGMVAMVVMMATSAMPANAAKAVCRTFDHDDFLLATGIDSEYGGTVCDME